MVSEGDLVADKYRIERLLGEGGMGHVHAAIHEQLGVRVAIKILSPTLCESDDAVRRFSREARASVRIQSEHVARVLDVGQLESGAPYMVMEFLNGNDLSRELKERGPFPIHEALQYVLQASEAVAEAHALGVIHRDLKPANLFLIRRPDGSPLVKVLDFGIAKALAPEQGAFEPSPSLTATHSFLGSPAYMSPEQVRTPKLVDGRSDIWSLGTILYEFLVGDLPFHGSNALDLLAAVASDPMPSIRRHRPDISPELEAVIAKCLEKKPSDRHQSVAAFAQALAPHAPPSSLPTVSRISGIQRGPAPVSLLGGPLAEGGTLRSTPPRSSRNTAASTPPEATPAPRSKHTITDFGHSQSPKPNPRRRLTVVAGVALLGVIGVVAVIGARAGSKEEGAAPAVVQPAAHAPDPAPAVTPLVVPQASAPVEETAAAEPSASAPPSKKAPRRLAPSVAPVRPPPAAAPANAPLPAQPAPGSDPLDGRR